MRFLVDSDVLSEPTKPASNASVVEWLRENELDLAVNPIVLGELEFGILKLPAGRRRAQLAEWFTQLAARLQILPLDGTTARTWANLLANLRRRGRPMPVRDSLIAATAIQHGLIVATRNSRDYIHTGLKVVNPFQI